MTETRKHYPDVDANPDFPKIEERILARWKQDNTFNASVEHRPAQKDGNANAFIFYDGPPFANGLPHYGHLLTGFVKDLFARYQTMRGKRVERRFGWDCHGLPAEMGAEKDLGISGRHAIMDYGIAKFNDYCRTSVMKYTQEWEYYVTRQARWVDFVHDYKTMDTSYMESVIWAFSKLYEKGLIYEAYRVMPYSWAAETPLSNFETRLDNSYRSRDDKAVTVAFELKEKPAGAPDAEKYYVLAWTTTPWTLPSNLALAVNKDIKYGYVLKNNKCYILAANAGSKYLHSELQSQDAKSDKIDIVHNDSNPIVLLGLTYHPLFPYFGDHPNSFRILDGSDFVTDADGTGIVHMAPGFGEDDQRVCEANGITLVCPVDHAGKFTSEIYDLPDLQLKGLNVLEENVEKFKFGEANERIIEWLKKHGQLIKQEQITHNYPHCWRTDKPLIYRAVPSWYVEVTKFRDRMVQLNQQINWIPEHVKDGQFGKWLENARDWSISRNRFWGTPIPIWKSDNPANKQLYVFGSIKELEEFFGKKVEDLHRPFIDELTLPDPLDPTYTIRRVEDVFDCWFESGSMPYAQVHYPFENKNWFETHFPADFIVEYVAQTRGWFYTLMVLSTAIFDKPPFLNCICHGVVLDDKGQKLSKRLNNYADPKEIFEQFGADALRWFMMASPVMRGSELYIDKEGKFIRDVVRLAIKPVWNAYNFFCLYANADDVKAEYSLASDNVMDRYILQKCADAVHSIRTALDNYHTPAACEATGHFFDALNNWYIRRSKPRFWSEGYDQGKQAAYNTLYTVLEVMCRAIAPLLPLVTEEIYHGLTDKEQSVHLADFPSDFVSAIEIGATDGINLLYGMEQVRDICNAALSVRNSGNIRVRQPLSSLTLVTRTKADDTARFDLSRFPDLMELVSDEVNVKTVKFANDFDTYATLKLQIHFPVLGKRLPEKIKQIIPASKKGAWEQLADGRIGIAGETLEPGEFAILLEPKPDYKSRAQSLSSNDALVILDTNITPELETEGYARDLVRLIQQARKDAGLRVTDRIQLRLRVSPQLTEALETHGQYISNQVLAETLSVGDMQGCSFMVNETIENEEVSIGISLMAAA
jgi:isoleucyl-tRNA synthetase